MHRRPRAFTLVELLVVISIIGMLVALLLPAVNAARETARKAACTNNIGQLAKAMHSHATSKGKFPGWRQTIKDGTAGSVEVLSWGAMILPQIERQDLWDAIRDPIARAYQYPPNGLQHTGIEVFQCPSNIKPNQDYGWLDYVVNTGYFDYLNLNPRDYKENGVFFDLTVGGPQHDAASIKDGASMTLLLSENIHKGGNANWLGTIIQSPNVPQFQDEQQLGMVWVYNRNAPYNPPPGMQQRINRDDPTGSSDPSQYARPSSNHPGGVVVAFCGGNADFLSEDIDYTVYHRLLTSHGRKCKWPEDPSLSLQPDFTHVPPLSESDFR